MTKPLRIMVFCETNTAYGRGLLEGINQYACEHNWLLSFEQRGRYDTSFGLYKPWHADGIISRTYHRSMYNMLCDSQLPLIELLGYADPNSRANVTMDEKYLAKLVADHFIEHGLRRFAYYCMEDAPLFYPRRAYFLEYLDSFGYPCDVFPTTWSHTDYVFPKWREEYRPKLRKWLRMLPKPIALYASLDQCAQVVLELCQELGINVPQEISLVAVGNDEWVCRLLKPSLSSVDGNSYTIGYMAAKMLNKKIRNELVDNQTIYIPASFLAVRQSSDFYAVDDPDVKTALEFIHKNACNRIQVRDILNEINVSQRTLYRSFKKYLNRTPQAEILRVQMESAKQLLRETNLAINIIAKRTGFSNDIYFIRAFHRECGMTPNTYRQQCRYGTHSSFH